MKRILLRFFLPVLFISLIVPGCVVQRSPVTGNKRAYGYSWEQELKIGKQADQQIQEQYGIYDNEELLQYVDNIGQEMLEVSHMRREDTPKKYRDTEFTFRVLDSPVINAFALPGGYVYVTRGLLAHLDNEAQLAVVLGHEIGHVAARHASQRAFEQQVGQLAVIGGAVVGEEFLGIPGGSILNLGSQAAQFLFLSYSRDDERESDALGVEYSAMKNYEAAEGSEFFVTLERMSKQSGQSIPDWQSTHPDPAERSKRIPRLAEEWRAKGYEQTIQDTDEFMGHIDNIIYGNNPREGFTRDGSFLHPELAFQFPYPQNWNVINQRSLVAVINADQDAIAIMRLDSKSESPQASVEEFLSQEGITPGEGAATSYNNLEGYEATATGQTQNGQQIKFYLYSVVYDGTIYRFITYTTLEQFATYQPHFEEIAQGFRDLKDQSVLSIQPVRLQVVRADRSGSFQSFLPDNYEDFPIDITDKDLAILNQVNLGDTIEEGQWIKIPRK
ncbi:MAG: M48 family metalloprotease [Balneolaceae bacterium]|nr:M48 family metalloprotease [Balneolaceae bacterium]